MRRFAGCAASALALTLSPPLALGADETYESVSKGSVAVQNLKRILLPFVASCEREKKPFRAMFCNALNERLKAQHQSKLYVTTHEPSEVGPLVARFKAKPKPTLEIEVLGCLTCQEPLLEREGGDISKGRFFLFKVPEEITIRRGKHPYDLGNIAVASKSVELPAEMTEKTFNETVLPHLKLELLFRPVAGVTMVGKRHKYGVLTFELVGHRVLHKCEGKVYSAEPKMAKPVYLVDKNDLSCPQNQPKKAVARVKLPSTLPQRAIKETMEAVSQDLAACYEQFGVGGQVPADIVVASSGQVKFVKVVGKLAGTPTGQCVERLVKHQAFPKFSGDDARLQWPFTLAD